MYKIGDKVTLPAHSHLSNRDGHVTEIYPNYVRVKVQGIGGSYYECINVRLNSLAWTHGQEGNEVDNLLNTDDDAHMPYIRDRGLY